MRKINKKKVVMLILLIVILIIMIKTLNDSRASKITEIAAKIVDTSGLLGDESITIEAVTEKDNGISITLPKLVNQKKVKSFIVEVKEIDNNSQKENNNDTLLDDENQNINNIQENQNSIQDTKNNNENLVEKNDNEKINQNILTEEINIDNLNSQNTSDEEKSLNEQNEENLESNNDNILQESENIVDSNVVQNENNISSNEQEKLPGEKVYLTKEEIKNKQITLKVNYDVKEKNGTSLYNQVIEKEIDSYQVTISGYMPENATIQAEKANAEQVEELAKEHMTEKTILEAAYDIKILVEDLEYEPTDFDENVEVQISGIVNEENKNNKYKVIHIDNENKVEEIKEVKVEENQLVFKAKEFSTYAVLSEEGVDTSTYTSRAAVIKTETEWDGSTISSGFAWGNGTADTPYLISDGTELAYLASQVNSGTTYEGTYFQITNDIDLGNCEWTTIGTTDNSFRGILDGAGHTIANAKITITDLPSSTYESYGLFGSIGGGNSRAIIRNLEISTININITASGDTGSWFQGQDEEGYHIGILSGTMYKNASILNTIVKNSNITDSNTITIYNYQFRLAVGGVVGFITNTSTSNTDPGAGNRYIIENCFSDTTISLDVSASYTNSWGSTRDGRSQFHAGGIVGTIRSQPVWPTDCLYKGSITTNGFIGPVFGALINNTSYTSYNNFATLWNGNDAGNLTTDNMYYSAYTANGTSFTQSVTSGTSTARRSNSTNNIGYVQGVNKGSYTTNMNTMLSMFNGNITDTNKYLTWVYENETFSFKTRLTTTVDESEDFVYTIVVTDPYQIGTYEYIWYKDGIEDTTIQGNTYAWTPNYNADEDMMVITNDGEYYSIVKFLIKKIGVDIVFNIDETNDTVTASLEGEGLRYTTVDDYTFQWYQYDLAGDGGAIVGATSLTLTNLEEGMDYKLIATNNVIPQLSTENTFTYGDRIVVFVDYNNGNNAWDGFTEETAVRTLDTAYTKLSSTGNRNTNVIVMIGDYTDTNVSFLNSRTATTYQKKATITGKYAGKNYNANFRFGGSDIYRHLTEDLTLQYMQLNGNGGSMYFCLQGHSFTMGEGVTMINYKAANSNQGLLGGNAPAFHLFAGWYQYNYSALPNNNSKVIIKSGTFGRIILGGTPGTSSGLRQQTSLNFTGSPSEYFNVSLDINIQNSTTASNYDYDVNLLVGGSASGNNYSEVTENIKSGKIGRVLGGSIGDASAISNNWRYPINTFLGQTTINLSGGTVEELYGGCLGRNMNVVGNANATGNTCDSYFYGDIILNMTGGTITGNIYGAGAGGVTGYSANSSDPYKSYGESFSTSVNLNISGGTVEGNIYGGGYGYTEYLNANVTANDGGALYGDSTITITGSPTINGDIYASGCGYDFSSRPNLAQMEGNSKINISGTPDIEGKIFGAGAGISGYDEMAKLIGDSEITIGADLDVEVYGGGNIAKTEGTTTIKINSGTHAADIYGGGNEGIIDGSTTVNINGGSQTRVFGGGNQAEVTSSVVTINGGTTTEVYAGGNSASVDTTNVYLKGGIAYTIYGGSNQTGIVQKSNVETTSGTAGTIYGGNNIGGSTTESNITINGGTINEAVYGGGNHVDTTKTIVNISSSENTIPNVYGGGNQAGVTETYIYCNGGSANNIFGGSNTNGTVETSNVEVNSGTFQNVYGGNNQGGITLEANVNIKGGDVTDVYGGGNQAVTDVTNVEINGNVIGNVYGGGNQAGINTNTNVNIIGGTVGNNIYGGGNEGTVTQDTFVHIKNATINNSVYAGGNGSTAVVYGNTNLVMDGTTNNVQNSVFGGGNKAATGEESKKTSKSTVNIVTGNIGKNVYGGANTSVVYGTTQTNIGYDAVNDSTLEKGNVGISGTVFGGGEANESGSEDYDFSFISVTNGIDIQIDGNSYEEFWIRGSIFGSGNASSTSGESYITIKNYGTADNPQSNISIQRSNCATIINSAIALSGATDRTNEYSSTYFSLSRVDRVKLKNNSSLFLCNGANLLKNLDSVVDIDGEEVKAEVQINSDTGETTKNVDNRIYMLEGKNLNIATNEQVTAYGQVYGMMFFGLFTNRMNPGTSTGFYYKGYENGDTITNAGTFSSNSYAMAQHMVDHNTEVDGFYTNYNEDGVIKVDYIGTTPEDDVYYIWLVGEKMDVTVFEIALTASKYATLGTYELSLKGFSDKNLKFVLNGFSAGLANGISLVDPSEIEVIASTEDIANTVYGLSMRTGNVGWKTKGSTTFLTRDGGTYSGTNEYDADNSTYTPTFNFCFYHSENISLEQSLGEVKIRLQVLKPIDDLNYDISYIDINVTLSSALYQYDFYEAAITPGQEFGLFTSTETTITNKSTFSTYYSLYIENFSESDYYDDYKTYKRALISRDSQNEPYSFPENTKITMLDMVTNQYYYYIVTATDVSSGKYIYEFSDFIAMGSNDKGFNEVEACDNYYNEEQDLIYENFIFHINFADTNIQNNIINNSLLMELRDSDAQTLIGVLGIQRDIMVYTVYVDKDATIELSGEITPNTIYLGKSASLNVTTNFTQKIEDSKSVYDTQYFDKKLGIKISIYDSYGNKLSNDSLLGISFELDGILHYPRIDGTTRINISDKVTDVLSKIKINTENNKTLATGDYKIRVESFGSSDGIYYGLTSSDMIELDLKIINSSYGLNVRTGDKEKIIDNVTGYTLNGNNSLLTIIEYSSSLSNPNIAVSLYRRDYSEIFSQNYVLVDLKDYVLDSLKETTREKEYIISENPMSTTNKFFLLKSNLMTGTYKFVYKLYDGDTFVGEAYEYMIIK